MRKHMSDGDGPEKTTAEYDETPFNECGDHTFWLMPHSMGVEMAVVGPYHGEDKMLAAARRIVDEQMDHEDDNVYALAIDGNGVPAIRPLGHLVDECEYGEKPDDGDQVSKRSNTMENGKEPVAERNEQEVTVFLRSHWPGYGDAYEEFGPYTDLHAACEAIRRVHAEALEQGANIMREIGVKQGPWDERHDDRDTDAEGDLRRQLIDRIERSGLD